MTTFTRPIFKMSLNRITEKGLQLPGCARYAKVGIAPRPFLLPVFANQVHKTTADLDRCFIGVSLEGSILIALSVAMKTRIRLIVSVRERHADFILLRFVEVLDGYKSEERAFRVTF